MNYSNVLYNGVEAITLPLSHSRLPIVVAYDSGREMTTQVDVAVQCEVLDEFPHTQNHGLCIVSSLSIIMRCMI